MRRSGAIAAFLLVVTGPAFVVGCASNDREQLVPERDDTPSVVERQDDPPAVLLDAAIMPQAYLNSQMINNAFADLYSGHHWDMNRCLMTVRVWAGLPSKHPNATAAWSWYKKWGVVNTSRQFSTMPEGAWVFYKYVDKTNTDVGHVMVRQKRYRCLIHQDSTRKGAGRVLLYPPNYCEHSRAPEPGYGGRWCRHCTVWSKYNLYNSASMPYRGYVRYTDVIRYW